MEKDLLHRSMEQEIGADEEKTEDQGNQSAEKVESDTESEREENFKDEERADDMEQDNVV